MLNILQVQKIAREATGFRYSFEIEDGELHLCFLDMDIIAEKKGKDVARKVAASGLITDKGFLFV